MDLLFCKQNIVSTYSLWFHLSTRWDHERRLFSLETKEVEKLVYITASVVKCLRVSTNQRRLEATCRKTFQWMVKRQKFNSRLKNIKIMKNYIFSDSFVGHCRRWKLWIWHKNRFKEFKKTLLHWRLFDIAVYGAHDIKSFEMVHKYKENVSSSHSLMIVEINLWFLDQWILLQSSSDIDRHQKWATRKSNSLFDLVEEKKVKSSRNGGFKALGMFIAVGLSSNWTSRSGFEIC